MVKKKYNNDTKTKCITSWKGYLDDYFIFWKCPWGSIDDLHNLHQNLHPKIKFTMKHSFKEIPLSLLKTKIAELSLIFTTNPQIPNNTPKTPKNPSLTH